MTGVPAGAALVLLPALGDRGWTLTGQVELPDMGFPLLLACAKQEIPGCECRRKRRQTPPKTEAKVPGHELLR